MLSSLLTIALRNLWKNKVFLIVNVMALGISMASFIAAYLWVAYDREFDDFHSEDQVANIYKVHSHWDDKQNILSPYALGPTATVDIAGIEELTRYSFEKGLIYNDHRGFYEGIGVADSSFFTLFDFPVLDGSLTSFSNEFVVVISKSLSNKLFGKENPINKSVAVKLGNDEPVQFFVGAVIQDIPHNTTFTFEMMMRIEAYQKMKGIKPNSWSPWPAVSTFFEVSDRSNITDINALLAVYIEDHEINIDHYTLEHFKSEFTMSEILGAMVNVRMWQTPIRILVIMAIVLFMIACFNLSNTSFSLMAQRMNEIGVRRTLGASRSDIIFQFILEIAATLVLSLMIGLLIANYIVPQFADIWANGVGNRWDTLVFRIDHVDMVSYLIALLMLLTFGVTLAGIYPAIYFSKLKPVVLFKRDLKVGGTNLFSRALLVFQFSISLIMLITCLVFVINSSYMQQKDFGYDKDQVIHVKMNDKIELKDFQRLVSQVSGVEQTTWAMDALGSAPSRKASINQLEISVRPYRISVEFLDLMGLELKEGRKLLKSDHKKGAVVTELFVQLAGLERPVGERLSIDGHSFMIVGVVRDIEDHWRMNKKESKNPHVFVLADPGSSPDYMVIRTVPDKADEVLESIAEVWLERYPFSPFQGGMLLKGGPYQTSMDIRNIFIFLTFMTGLLSCLGIYTLAALNVRKQMKEIGIRKVLGSSIFQIVKRVNREFLLVLSLAAVLGTFTTHRLMNWVIQSDHSVLFIDIRWEWLASSAVFLVVIGLATSALIIARGANQNPVDLLRDE